MGFLVLWSWNVAKDQKQFSASGLSAAHESTVFTVCTRAQWAHRNHSRL